MRITTVLISVFVSIFFYTTTHAQIPLDWSPHVDSVSNCKFLRNGIFKIDSEKLTPQQRKYSIEIRDSIMKEHIGRYFIESSIRFIDDCHYETIVIETNVPGSYKRIGEKYEGFILMTATADDRILVHLKSDGKEDDTFIFLKVSD